MQKFVVHGRSSGSSVVLAGKQGLPLKQRGKIYKCCVRPLLLCCYETWQLTVANQARLLVVDRRMIKRMCGVRLVERLSTEVLQDRVGVVVKIGNMIMENGLRWYCHAIGRDINLRLWSLK